MQGESYLLQIALSSGLKTGVRICTRILSLAHVLHVNILKPILAL